MAGENKIYYNGSDLGSSPHHAFGHRMPTPMLSVSADMINLGERWGQTHKISLEGQLTGYFWGSCGADQWEERDALILKFHENFRDLQVYEDGAEILSFPNCKVESINFSESTFGNNVLDYSIELTSYDNFSGIYGVLDPVDTLSFSEGEDGVINLTHEISCKGFKTTAGDGSLSTPFANAQNWVINRTGWDNTFGGTFAPAFIPNDGTIFPLLISQSETIDRFNASYGITEQWQFQTKDVNGNFITQLSPIDTYSIQFNEASYDGDENTVQIELTRKGDLDYNLDIATLAQTPSPAYLYNIIQSHKEAFSDFMPTNVELHTHRQIIENLFSDPKSFDVNVDTFTNTNVYSATFSDVDLFNGENVYWDVRYNIEANSITEMDTVTVSGPLVARAKNRLQRDIDIKAFIDAREAEAGGLIGYCYNEAVAAYNSSKKTIHGQHNYFANVAVADPADRVSYIARGDVLCRQPNNFSFSVPRWEVDKSDWGSTHARGERGDMQDTLGGRSHNQVSWSNSTWTEDQKYQFGGNGEWTLTASFDTSPHLPGDNVKFNYDFTVEHGIHIFTPSPDLKTNGYYVVYDIGGHKKEKISINTNLNYNANHVGEVNHGLTNRSLMVGGNTHDFNNTIINNVTQALGGEGYYIDSESSSGGTQSRNQVHSRTIFEDNKANGPQGGQWLPYTDAESYIPPQ